MNSIISGGSTERLRIFSTIRSCQKQWGLALVVILMASWLSVHCMECYTALDESFGHVAEPVDNSMHCMDPSHTTDSGKKGEGDGFNTCCDGTLSVVSIKQDVRETVLKLPLDDKYNIGGNELEYPNNINIDIAAYPVYKEPDRAYFLPFSRYTVLLN